MPVVLLDGVNVNYSTSHNAATITMSDTTVDGRVSVYFAYTAVEQLVFSGYSAYTYDHPTIIFASSTLPNGSIVGGLLSTLPTSTNQAIWINDTYVDSSRDAQTYIWKSSFTPTEDYVGSGSITIPSNFIGNTYVRQSNPVLNMSTGRTSYTYTTFTSYASSVSTSFSIDTEISYDLTVSAPLSLESPQDNLDPDLISVDEGHTATFTLQTTHLSAGRTLAYRIDGTQLSDLGGVSLTGSVTIGADGRAILAIPIAEDETIEGLESITLTILNIQGSDEVSQTIQIIDTSLTPPPSLSLALRNDSGRSASDWLTNIAELEIQGLEAGAYWEYSLNGGLQWLLGQGTSLTVDGDGSQQVMVRQIDQNGAPSDVTLIGFDVDTIAQRPTLSLLSDSGSSVSDLYTYAGLILIDDLEVDSEWEYSQDGGNIWQLGVGNSLFVNEDGYHQILIRQTDLAGNTSEISELTFTLDTEVLSPDLNLRSDSGSSGDLLTNIGVIDLGGLESGSAWSYSLDSGLNWAVGQGSSITVSGDGAKQVQVSQVDRAGNLSEINELNFVLDTQAYSRPNLNLLQLLDKELEVAEDLDGDDLIGNVVTEAGTGSDNLQIYKTKTNTFVLEEVGLSVGDSVSTIAVDLMSSLTKSWVVKAGSIIEGLVEIDDQYVELLIQSGTSYTAQKFDLDTGMIYGRALKLNDAALQAREYAYDQDLNNDGTISLIGQTSAPTDWVF